MRHLAVLFVFCACYSDSDMRSNYDRGRNECVLPLKQQFLDRCKKTCSAVVDGKTVERPIVTDMTGDPAKWMCGCVPAEMAK